jgi:hypothetical protein
MNEKHLARKGKAFVIICEWILKVRELAFRQLRENQVLNRKGELPPPGVSLDKFDSKNLSFYNKQVPSYRWPKDYAKKNFLMKAVE